MKELSIKEKAERYDEAIKVAKGNYETIVQMDNDCTFAKEGIVNTFHHIFPELKESEDEKIRKAIGYAIGQSTHYDGTLINGVSPEEALAWLEKQGKCTDYANKEYWRGYNEGKQEILDKYAELEKQGEHANFRNKIQIGDKVTRNEDGVLVNLSQLNRVAKKQTEQKLYVNDNAKEMFIKALERVEEQNNKGYKLTDCDKNSWWEDFKAYTSCTIEQKPAAWSDEDEQLYNDLSDTYFYNDEEYPEETYKRMLKRVLDWMDKRAKLLRPKQEWSEEDEILLKLSLENLTELKDRFGEYYGRVGGCIDWLKSLKERYA